MNRNQTATLVLSVSVLLVGCASEAYMDPEVQAEQARQYELDAALYQAELEAEIPQWIKDSERISEIEKRNQSQLIRESKQREALAKEYRTYLRSAAAHTDG